MSFSRERVVMGALGELDLEFSLESIRTPVFVLNGRLLEYLP